MIAKPHDEIFFKPSSESLLFEQHGHAVLQFLILLETATLPSPFVAVLKGEKSLCTILITNTQQPTVDKIFKVDRTNHSDHKQPPPTKKKKEDKITEPLMQTRQCWEHFQLNWNHGNQAWHTVTKHWMMLIVKRYRKLKF